MNYLLFYLSTTQNNMALNLKSLPSDVLITMITQLHEHYHNEKKYRIAFNNIIFNFRNEMYQNTMGELYASYQVIDEVTHGQDVMCSTYRNIINERNIFIDKLIKKCGELKQKLSDEKTSRKKLEQEKKIKERELACEQNSIDRELAREQRCIEREQAREQRKIEKRIFKFKLNPNAKEFVPSTN